MGKARVNIFEGNKKIFWKKVHLVRKGNQARDKMVKDMNDVILLDGVVGGGGGQSNFVQVLNVDDGKEVILNVVGEKQMPIS